jgi:hypothetical protein
MGQETQRTAELPAEHTYKCVFKLGETVIKYNMPQMNSRRMLCKYPIQASAKHDLGPHLFFSIYLAGIICSQCKLEPTLGL